MSISDFLSKIALRKADIFLVSWVKVSFAFLFLLAGIGFMPPISINRQFIMLCLFLYPIEIIALLLYVKAIQISPLSLTVPFLALTPIFLIFTSYMMLGERLDHSGLSGILLITIGSYVLHIDQAAYGLFRPIQAIFREKGSWMMIIVAGIYSITSNLGKMAILETNPVFFAVFHSGMMTLLVMPLLLIFSQKPIFKRLKEQIWIFIGIGLSMASMILSHMMAVMSAEVAYMISIKRTSPIFTVLLGCLFLDERDLSERLMGSTIMFIGVLLILF